MEVRGRVPVVDVSALITELGRSEYAPGSIQELSKEAQDAVNTLHDVCRGGSGGLIAINHGFEKIVKEALSASLHFHELSTEEEKATASRLHMYDAVGEVKIAVRPPSLHERLLYPRVIFPEDGNVTTKDIIAGIDHPDASPPDTIYAHDPPLLSSAFDTAMRNYQRCIRSLSLSLLRAISLKLGLSSSYFDRGWETSNSGLATLHYLAIPNGGENCPISDGYVGAGSAAVDNSGDGIGDLGATLRVYPHADGASMFTCLVHDKVEGLQVLERGHTTSDDVWIDVPCVEKTQIVIQIGQMTQRFTNDEYKATPHRVLKPELPAQARTSLTFFFRPGLDTLLEVPRVLKRPNDAGSIYETVSVRDHMLMARSDKDGKAVKLTSNILRDGRWIGARVC